MRFFIGIIAILVFFGGVGISTLIAGWGAGAFTGSFIIAAYWLIAVSID